jgi:hypothetical protein
MDIALEWISNSPICVFKRTFGIPCPGCGMTRAFIHLFQLDLKGAFYYHPLFFLVPVVFIVFLFRKKVLFFTRLSQNKGLIYGIIGLIFAVYAFRMGTMFPKTSPMDYYPHSMIATIWDWLPFFK